MNIDGSIWRQHTIAEARYNGKEMAVHVRIPAKIVIEARDLFLPKDIVKFNPHINLEQQPYQFHIFNGTKGDAYINDVPFYFVKDLLWYLHKHPEERDELVTTNMFIPFDDFERTHDFSKKPGIVWLYVGHEKYGLFDWIQKDRFNILQLHRAALYGAFLRDLDYVFKAKDIGDALPAGVKKEVENGESLTKAVEKGMDFTIHSILEAFTLIVDGGDSRLNKGKLSVCKEHNLAEYWVNYKGRKIYRIIDPTHPKASDIKQELEDIVEKRCPSCSEAILSVVK